MKQRISFIKAGCTLYFRPDSSSLSEEEKAAQLETWKATTKSALERLAADYPFDVPENIENYSGLELIVSSQDFGEIVSRLQTGYYGIKLSLEYKGTSNATVDLSQVATNIHEILSEQISKLESLLTRASQNSGPDHPSFNSKCDVHLPGHLMTTYNEVSLLEDVCTDFLQTQISAGWRLLAICPQPDQRRPDYILGRWNPEKEGSYTSAERK